MWNTAESRKIIFLSVKDEFVISAIYILMLGNKLDFVFAISALGTTLHMTFQLSELWLNRNSLPALKNSCIRPRHLIKLL